MKHKGYCHCSTTHVYKKSSLKFVLSALCEFFYWCYCHSEIEHHTWTKCGCPSSHLQNCVQFALFCGRSSCTCWMWWEERQLLCKALPRNSVFSCRWALLNTAEYITYPVTVVAHILHLLMGTTLSLFWTSAYTVKHVLMWNSMIWNVLQLFCYTDHTISYTYLYTNAYQHSPHVKDISLTHLYSKKQLHQLNTVWK
jgi:hypothetical protein